MRDPATENSDNRDKYLESKRRRNEFRLEKKNAVLIYITVVLALSTKRYQVN